MSTLFCASEEVHVDSTTYEIVYEYYTYIFIAKGMKIHGKIMLCKRFGNFGKWNANNERKKSALDNRFLRRFKITRLLRS